MNYCERINGMKSLFFCAYLLIAVSFGADANENIIPPKLIENLNSTQIQETSSYSRLEGWVYMTYMVNEKGRADHIQVIAHSNNDKFIPASVSFLENLRFKPATVNGQKTSYQQTYFMRHKKSFAENSNEGITTYFQKKYNQADNHVNRGELAQSERLLNDLVKTNTKNLTEQALAAWLLSKHFYKAKKWTQYRDHMLDAFYLRAHLPKELAIKATQNLLDWQIFRKLYSDALVTIVELAVVAEGNVDTSSIAQTMVELNEALEKPVINTRSTISPDKLWQHKLQKQNLSITPVNGELSFVEVRCANGRFSQSGKGFNNLYLADELGHCVVFVGASKETNISIIETGQVRQ